MSDHETPIDSDGERNIIETALAAGRALAPRVIDNPIKDGMPFVVLSDGDGTEHIEFLAARFDNPSRCIANDLFHDTTSFIAAWGAHSRPSKKIYANSKSGVFTAIFDDHGTIPGYRQHRAIFCATNSPEYTSWIEQDKKAFQGNVEFAHFIEDNLPDIVSPAGADMLELALNFQANENAAFSTAANLQNGATKLAYTSDINTGELIVPNTFKIEIPVYAGMNQPRYMFEARLRYRLNSSKLTIWYHLIRPHKVVEQAFADMLEKIASECNTRVLLGEPR